MHGYADLQKMHLCINDHCRYKYALQNNIYDFIHSCQTCRQCDETTWHLPLKMRANMSCHVMTRTWHVTMSWRVRGDRDILYPLIACRDIRQVTLRVFLDWKSPGLGLTGFSEVAKCQVKPKPGSIQASQVWPDINNGSPGLYLKNSGHSGLRAPVYLVRESSKSSLASLTDLAERTMTAPQSKL